MFDFLEQLLEQGEVIFWLLLALGSGVASWLKNRKQAARKSSEPEPESFGGPAADLEEGQDAAVPEFPARPTVLRNKPLPQTPVPQETSPNRPTLPPWLTVEGDPQSGWKVRAKKTTRPAEPEPEPLAAPLSVSQTQRREFEEAVKDRGALSERLSQQWGDQEDVTEQEPVSQAWKPTGSWRDAIIAREVLGPPRALSGSDLPGLS